MKIDEFLNKKMKEKGFEAKDLIYIGLDQHKVRATLNGSTKSPSMALLQEFKDILHFSWSEMFAGLEVEPHQIGKSRGAYQNTHKGKTSKKG